MLRAIGYLLLFYFVAFPASLYGEELWLTAGRENLGLYHDQSRDILIFTGSCDRSEDAILKLSKEEGRVYLIEKDCEVEGAYKGITTTPGNKAVRIDKESDNWYKVIDAEMFIRTKMCFAFAFREDATLEITAERDALGVVGKLRFPDGGSCEVLGIYKALFVKNP